MFSSFIKKLTNEKKELTNKQRLSIPFDVFKTHLFPQINFPKDVFNLRLTCKLFYNDYTLLNCQESVLETTVKYLKGWKRITVYKNIYNIIPISKEVKIEDEYFIQKQAIVTRLKYGYDSIKKFELRVANDAYYVYKLENVTFWNGIDQYNIIINNHLYKFFIPLDYPMSPPRIEWYTCPSPDIEIIDIKEYWSPAMKVYNICDMIRHKRPRPCLDNCKCKYCENTYLQDLHNKFGKRNKL